MGWLCWWASWASRGNLVSWATAAMFAPGGETKDGIFGHFGDGGRDGTRPSIEFRKVAAC